MEMVKVSIIMPCYNQAEFIERTLKKLQKQTLQQWECIIIDDGSTDDSAKIVSQLVKEDYRFCLITKENGGTASARNVGLDRAQGEYIQFLDADDFLDDNKLLSQVNFMEENNLEVSYTGYSFFKDDNEVLDSKLQMKLAKPLLSYKYALLTRWGVSFTIPLHCFMYRRTFLSDNSLLFNSKIRYREDWNFHIRISKLCKEVRYINYLGAYYRMNPSGKTSTYLKVLSGNLNFITLKAKELKGIDKVAWCFRLSEELWQLVFRSLKHKELKAIKLIPTLYRGLNTTMFSICAIALLPISIFAIVARTVRIYIR